MGRLSSFAFGIYPLVIECTKNSRAMFNAHTSKAIPSSVCYHARQNGGRSGGFFGGKPYPSLGLGHIQPVSHACLTK